MPPLARALALALACAAPQPAPGIAGGPRAPAAANAPAAPAPQAGRDYDAPPPGSREDQALWKAAYEANNEVTLARHAAARLQLRAKVGDYDGRLSAAAGRGPDAARRAGDLRRRLQSAWSESVDLLVRQWPVDPTRACRYPLMNFEGVMFADEGPKKAAQLAGARQDLEECLGQARLALGAIARSNAEFEAVLDEADRELGVAAPAAGPPAASTAPPPRSGEGAR